MNCCLGHTACIDSLGFIYTTGLNSCGQLGLGDTMNRYGFQKLTVRYLNPDTLIKDTVTFAFIACGEEYCVAVAKGSRHVYSW